ncbi:MAG: metallophosphoesterase [Nitrososphaerota archaeon]|nr:metallophosphoesterase [Nitrososphaerota archaeon]
MKILVVSDVHFELGSHHGTYEGGAYDWLLRTVKLVQPTALIGLGDYGHAWTAEQWETLASLVPLHLVYGNHENMEELVAVKNTDGRNALIDDGGNRMVDGLKIGAINGIVSRKTKIKDGTPRQTPEEYLRHAPWLAGVDVLATHMAPREMASGFIHENDDLVVMDEVLKVVKPKLFLCGHLGGPYKIATIGGTVGVRVDSSPAEQHYAVITGDESKVNVYHNHDLVDSVSITLARGR